MALADDFQKAVYNDPERFCREWLGVELWHRQSEALRLMTQNRFCAIKSGNAVGKTFLGALAVCVFMLSSKGFVVTSASGFRGTAKGIWPVIHRIANGLPKKKRLGGRLNDTSWKIGPQWEAFAVAASTPENFAGFRGQEGTTVLVDEASGLTSDIFEAIMGLAAGNGRVIFLGNPLRAAGPFYDAFLDPTWATATIASTEAADANVPGLADWDWIEGRRAAWGEDSDLYRVRVLGEFPTAGGTALIPVEWAGRVVCSNKANAAIVGDVRIGVDVARYGSDNTAFIVRDDTRLLAVYEYPKTSLMEVCGKSIELLRHYGTKPENVYIDDAGLGGGVTDRLWEQGYSVTAVNFGSAAVEKERYKNMRAECYWHMRSALDPDSEYGGFKIPAKYSELLSEASAADVGYSSKGQLELENKDKVRAKIGRSPDRADALAMTFAAEREVEERPQFWMRTG